MLRVGVKIYQYTRGMLHSKVMIVDDDWASVGSANLDNRSLHLNFEMNCLIYSAEAVTELARAFEATWATRFAWTRKSSHAARLPHACWKTRAG